MQSEQSKRATFRREAIWVTSVWFLVFCSYLFTHHVPMPVLYAGIAERRDERHVDLELLQLAFDLGGSAHRAAVVGVSEQLRQLVRVLPDSLHLKVVDKKVNYLNYQCNCSETSFRNTRTCRKF